MIASRTYPYDLVSGVLSGRLHGRTASDELQTLARRQSIDWDGVIGCASIQYVLPAFAAALRDLDLIQFMEEELAAFLAAVHAANLERNSELRDELSRAVGVLNRIGIEPVLLKGAIRLVDGLYPDMGWRMLRDLDLLVQKEALGEAIRAFEEAGYAPCSSGTEMQRPLAGACQIDLHSEAFFTPRQVRLLQAADILDQAEAINLRDGRVWIPSVEHQIVHLIGHCQLRHLGHAFGRISLCDLLEAAALVNWGGSRIRWEAIFERFVAIGYRRPLLSFLLGLNDRGWCAVPLADEVDPLTALQQRRIALQARSTAFGYTSSRIGWWISAFSSQVEESDGGERKGINNLKRLISERGAIARMARSFMSRRRHLMHVLPYLGWFSSQ